MISKVQISFDNKGKLEGYLLAPRALIITRPPGSDFVFVF